MRPSDLLAPALLVAAGLLCSCGGGSASGPAPRTQQLPPQQQQQPPSQPEVSRESGGGGGEGNSPRHHRNRRRKHGGGGDPMAAANPTTPNVTGNFDFYLLSLSWSPGFCATPAGQNDPGQCAPGRRFAFVLHGLWPQYEGKGWPEDCSNAPMDSALVSKMLPMMPSERLIRHEWSKHGTCSGLEAADYFEEAAEAFHSIRIPAPYQHPSQALTVSPATIRSEFAAANPGIGEQGFVVMCSGNGRYLSEVHACLTKQLSGRACNREELSHQCRSDAVLMRPVR